MRGTEKTYMHSCEPAKLQTSRKNNSSHGTLRRYCWVISISYFFVIGLDGTKTTRSKTRLPYLAQNLTRMQRPIQSPRFAPEPNGHEMHSISHMNRNPLLSLLFLCQFTTLQLSTTEKLSISKIFRGQKIIDASPEETSMGSIAHVKRPGQLANMVVYSSC